ncbi:MULTISPECIES: hypothetical protein [unclassified Brenneria]|uniref:hypothetical protein n=1 Tax=unclassified Brenneria TaxID=2634434 RepID=UPI0029C111A8|nr:MULTISPECIES: hypothetical protein [unclassified Brenneria]MDX5626641.1 hypothetical protein [Brenneria sp. L3-3Z]MDX5694009.1 hypothetical protein [Brenneria sp. L4-2C]
MQNKTEKIILRDSEEAASIKTVTGWVSAKGRVYGDNEDLARYDGATHQRCPIIPNILFPELTATVIFAIKKAAVKICRNAAANIRSRNAIDDI